MRTEQPSNPLMANTACFAAMAFWAVGFPAGEILLETWGTVILIVIRLLTSILLLALVWLYLDGYSAIRDAPWLRALFIGGSGFGLGAVLLLYGQKLSDPVTPAIAAAMMPIFGAILEVFLDGRKLRINLIAGILLALTGGLLATGVNIFEAEFGFGALICVIAVCLFAWATRAATKNLQSLSPMGQTTTTLAGGLCFNSAIFAALWIFGGQGIEVGTFSGSNIFHFLIFSISSLAIAQFLWIWGAGKLGILLASFHMNAMPFYVMVFVVLFFGNDWNWGQASGAALVALGVLVAQFFRPQKTMQTAVTLKPPKVASPEMRTCQPFMWTGT